MFRRNRFSRTKHAQLNFIHPIKPSSVWFCKKKGGDATSSPHARYIICLRSIQLMFDASNTQGIRQSAFYTRNDSECGDDKNMINPTFYTEMEIKEYVVRTPSSHQPSSHTSSLTHGMEARDKLLYIPFTLYTPVYFYKRPLGHFEHTLHER